MSHRSPGLEVKGGIAKLPFTSALTQARSYVETFELLSWFCNHHNLIISTSYYNEVNKAPSANSHSPNKMGRAAYDTTYICNTKDSAAEDAIAMHRAKAAEAAKIAAIEAAEAAEAKLIRSKKSRGIMAARKAAKEQAVDQTDTYESEGDSDTTTKP